MNTVKGFKIGRTSKQPASKCCHGTYLIPEIKEMTNKAYREWRRPRRGFGKRSRSIYMRKRCVSKRVVR